MIEHLLLPLVCERFKNESKYREGHLRVINALPARRVIGVHSPEIKLLAKQLSHKGCNIIMPDGTHKVCVNGAEIIRAFETVADSNLSYEETIIWGLLINLEKCPIGERLAMLSKYVPTLDNWAVCDSYCAHAKWIARADKHLIWNYLQQWYNSNKEFEVRFAIVISMCYFIDKEYLGKVFMRLDSINLEYIKSKYKSIKGKPTMAQQGTVSGTAPYYVRMGIAWFLATALAKYPEETKEFIHSSHLPDDVIKLYIRKARESFRTRNIDAT